ncbi:MAG TPA: amidohydrolase [Anaerovoracaceae bacterium]|nr:amidohydrolase [Anaerovoracaceae bacterium]
MKKENWKKIFVWVVVFAFVLSTFPVPSSAAAEIADSVYINGNIYTMDEDQPNVSALAVKGQKLIYVGNDVAAKDYIGNNTKVVDLKGKTVIPGLLEGHMHLPMLGENLLKVDAFWKPKAEIIAAVKAEVAKVQPGEWITGFGWNNTIWEDKAYPTKEDLDAVAPNNPVVLDRTDGHMIWVNSKALEMAGITKDTMNPQGGEILKDASGNPTGCLTDTAGEPVQKIIPTLSDDREKEAILKAQSQLLSYGFTSIMDAGSNMKMINMYHDLYKDKTMKIRLYSLIGGDWGGTIGQAEKDYIAKNAPQKELYDYRLSINAVKFFADGSLGSRSAALLEDYSDRPGHKGNYKFTDDQIYTEMKDAYDKGYQIATHDIGDGAVNQVINTYEKLMKANPREDARLRIEHFQVAQVSDIKRIADLKILPAMQPTHATSDKTMAEDRIGAERMKGAYAWRKVIESGNIIVGGSDAPVELVNPYHGFYAAVTRQSRDGQPDGGWYISEGMTREEVLKAFTIWTAYGQFEEDLKGSLEIGKLADFVVIDRDYMKCPANEIKDIQVLITVLGGEAVYQKDVSKASVIWQGIPISFSVAPVIRDGKLYVEAAALADKLGVTVTQVGDQELVPIRDVLEKFEYSLIWNNLSKSVSID